jgi:putative membrane protein
MLLGSASAHNTLVGPDTFASAWNWDPWILLGLGLSGGLYARGLWVLWRRAGVGKGVGVWQALSFAVGLYTLFLALISPLDALGHTLFSAHMAQHMLLILVAAPLLVFGAPLLPCLWALPRGSRRAMGAWWKGTRSPYRLWHALTQPLIVWCVFAVTLWIWHLPSLYQAAVATTFVHALEHATMMAAALLFWWLVIQPIGQRRLNYGAALLFVFTTSVQSTVLGALFVFAPSALYPVYAEGARLWGLTLLEDQQLAGLIMRTPGTFIFLFTAGTLFLLWLREMERQAAPQAAQKASLR